MFGWFRKSEEPEPALTPQQRLDNAKAELLAADLAHGEAWRSFQASGYREAERQRLMEAEEILWRAQKAHTLALREVTPFVPLQPAKGGV